MLELNPQCDKGVDQDNNSPTFIHTIGALITVLICPFCLMRTQQEDTSYKEEVDIPNLLAS